MRRQRLEYATSRNDAVTAPADDAVELPPQGVEIGDFSVDLGKMPASNGVDCPARAFRLVCKPQ
jgi:hypothetical protein